MNKLLTTTLIAASAIASAATVTSNGSATTNSTWADINLAKFNSSLGTLTDIQVAITNSVFGGSFTATSPSSEDTVTVNSVTGNASVRQKSSNTLGFTTVSSGAKTLNTDTSFPADVINDVLTVNITSTDGLTLTSYTIDSSFFSAYQSVGGLGNVVFQTRVSPSVNADVVGAAEVNNAGITTTTNLVVTYTYTPVPEASTYGIALGGLALAAVVVRRRKQAK